MVVMKMDILIGRITHFYDKIGVAIIEVVSQKLKIGDAVKISGHDQEFIQTVKSLQKEHEQVDEVKKGETTGMKVDKPVKAGDTIYLVGN
jgi:translation initiation factor IF-2